MRVHANTLATYFPERNGATADFYCQIVEQVQLAEELRLYAFWFTEAATSTARLRNASPGFGAPGSTLHLRRVQRHVQLRRLGAPGDHRFDAALLAAEVMPALTEQVIPA
jgi:hypothetical protein